MINDIENRKKELLQILNEALKFYEPIDLADFNKIFKVKQTKREGVFSFESNNYKWGITDTGDMSTMSLIATITDVLCDTRLAFCADSETNRLISFCWYDT